MSITPGGAGYPSVLFIALPQAQGLTGVLACERRGWDAHFVDDVLDGLEQIDHMQPDIVIVPLSPPHLRLDELCLAATRSASRRRAVIAWSEGMASPTMVGISPRSGVVTCSASTEGLCDAIADWWNVC